MKWRSKNPSRTWRVKSQNTRNPDTGELLEYLVELWEKDSFEKDRWICSCRGFRQRGKDCKHILQKIEEIKNKQS